MLYESFDVEMFILPLLDHLTANLIQVAFSAILTYTQNELKFHFGIKINNFKEDFIRAKNRKVLRCKRKNKILC